MSIPNVLYFSLAFGLLVISVSSGDISPFSPPFLRATAPDKNPHSTLNYIHIPSSSSNANPNYDAPHSGNSGVEPLPENAGQPQHGGSNNNDNMNPNLASPHNIDNPMYNVNNHIGYNTKYNPAHNPSIPIEYMNSNAQANAITTSHNNNNALRNTNQNHQNNNFVHPHSPVPASFLNSGGGGREAPTGAVKMGRPQLRHLDLQSAPNRNTAAATSSANRNPTASRRNRSSNRVSEGHRLITRALWRIFDALMEKNEKVELQGRIVFIETAIKEMITSDSKLEGLMEMIKEENMGLQQQMEQLQHKLSSMERLTTRLEELESWQLTLERQKDAELMTHFSSKPVYTSCPSPFETVEGECFYVAGQAKKSWQDARRACSKYGGDLAAPRNLQSLRTYLQSLAYQPEYVWVGASRLGNGDWVWSVGPKESELVDMGSDTWNEDLPNGLGNCMGLYEGAAYRAYDYHCQEEDLYVCQFFL